MYFCCKIHRISIITAQNRRPLHPIASHDVPGRAADVWRPTPNYTIMSASSSAEMPNAVIPNPLHTCSSSKKDAKSIYPISTRSINACNAISSRGYQSMSENNQSEALSRRSRNTHPEPPVILPKTADFLPRLVMMARPSTQNPLLT